MFLQLFNFIIPWFFKHHLNIEINRKYAPLKVTLRISFPWRYMWHNRYPCSALKVSLLSFYCLRPREYCLRYLAHISKIHRQRSRNTISSPVSVVVRIFLLRLSSWKALGALQEAFDVVFAFCVAESDLRTQRRNNQNNCKQRVCLTNNRWKYPMPAELLAKFCDGIHVNKLHNSNHRKWALAESVSFSA